MPDPSSPPISVSPAISPLPDDLDLRLLDLEYEYVTNSSFHTDDLRDKFIQYYLIIVGVAFTLIIGLIENTTVDPLVFALIAFVLFLVGLILVMIFVRLRRVVLECYVASVLIKSYYSRHTSRPKDLASALLWDEDSRPGIKENPLSASSLLVLLMAVLNSAMLATAIFLILARPDLLVSGFPDPPWATVSTVSLAFAGSAILQWVFYFWRLRSEKTRSFLSQKQKNKAMHWGIDLSD